MTDAIPFPYGVREGEPFPNPDAGLVWLREVAAPGNPYAGVLFGAFAWTNPACHEPVAYDTPVPLLDPPAGGYVDLRTLDDRRLDVSASRIIAVDGPSDRGSRPWPVAGLPAVYAPHDPADALAYWRQLRGLHNCLLRALPDAKSRRAVAAELRRVQASIDDAADNLTACLNRWVSAAWTDAVNAGVNVEPNPRIPAAKRGGASPAGLVRLGINP